MPGPTPPLRLRVRLIAWYATCAGLLLGHAAWFFAMRRAAAASRGEVVAGGQIVLLCLIVLLVTLLATTPPDAMRLPRRRSETIIVGGAIALQLGAVLVASVTTSWRVAATSLAAVAVTSLLLRQLRALGWSAWAAAVVAWNPVVVYETGVRGSLSGFALLLAALAIAAGLKRYAKRRATTAGASG